MLCPKKLAALLKRLSQIEKLLLLHFKEAPANYLSPEPTSTAFYFHFHQGLPEALPISTPLKGKPFSLVVSEQAIAPQLKAVLLRVEHQLLTGLVAVQWEKRPLVVLFLSKVPQLEQVPPHTKLQAELDQDVQVPTDIQKNYVYKVYDSIAEHFSHTRYKPWPKVAAFIQRLGPSDLLLDVGCGNGKYMGLPQGYVLGCDRSQGLAHQAVARGHQVGLWDCLSLPLRSNSFTSVISIAVIHHLSTRAQRLRAVRQMLRVLDPKGNGLIYVWALQQEKQQFEAQDMLVNWALQDRFLQEGAGSEQQRVEGDRKVTVFKRYYHLFGKGELEGVVEEAGGQVLQSWYDQQNWAVVFSRRPESSESPKQSKE